VNAVEEKSLDIEGAMLAVVVAVAIGFPLLGLMWGLPDPMGPFPGPMVNHAVWAPIMMAVAGLALALLLVMLWGTFEAQRGRPPAV